MDLFFHILQWTLPAILSFLAAYFFYGRKRRDEERAAEAERRDRQKEVTDERIRELELKLEQMVPVAEAFRAMLISKMTHVHTKNLDRLLANIDDLSEPELAEMYELLEERITVVDHLIDQEEREAATIFPMVQRMVLNERKSPAVDVIVQMVKVPILVH